MIKKTLVLTGSVTLILIGLARCSWRSDRGSVRVVIPKSSLPANLPGTQRSYSCYLVNVSGPGISPTVGSQSLGNYSPDCIEVGVSSQLVSADLLSSDGVLIRIPSGRSRKVEVIGVGTSLSESCVGKNIDFLFQNGRVPELFSLAQANVDTLVDSAVSLNFDANSTKPVDRLASCFAKVDSTTAAKGVSVSKILVMNSDTTNVANGISVDLANGGLTVEAPSFDFDVGSGATSMANRLIVSPDHRRAMVADDGYGKNLSFYIDSQGVLASRSQEISGNVLQGFSDYFFNESSQYAYLYGGGSIRFLVSAATGGFALNSPSDIAQPSSGSYFSKGGFLYRLDISALGVDFNSSPIPAGGAALTLPFTRLFTVSDGTISNPIALTDDSVFYFSLNGTSLRYRRYSQSSSTGGLTEVKNGFLIEGLAEAPSKFKAIFSPLKKDLLILTNGMSTSHIHLFRVDGDGNPSESPYLSFTDEFLKDLSVDPSGKYFYVLLNNGASATIRSYALNGEITLSEKDTVSSDDVAPTISPYANKMENLVKR